MDDLIESIIAWQRKTFPETTLRGTLRHLVEEVVELKAADAPATILYEGQKLGYLASIKAAKEAQETAKERNVEEEIADLFFLAIQAADTCGVSIREALSKKLEKNKLREWATDQDEVARHVDG